MALIANRFPLDDRQTAGIHDRIIILMARLRLAKRHVSLAGAVTTFAIHSVYDLLKGHAFILCIGSVAFYTRPHNRSVKFHIIQRVAWAVTPVVVGCIIGNR